MRRRSCTLLLLFAVGCSSERTLRPLCEGGDPGACDVLSARYAYGDGVSKNPTLAAEFLARATELCMRADAGASPNCLRYPRPVPLEGPRSAERANGDAVLTVTLALDGTTRVDGALTPDDEGVLAAARTAREKNDQVRAVIKADSAVAHGRTIHVLDLLKQAGLSRIAFGVEPIGTTPSAVPSARRAAVDHTCSVNAAVAPSQDSVLRIFLVPGGPRCAEASRADTDPELTRFAREHLAREPRGTAEIHGNQPPDRAAIHRAIAALRAGGIGTSTVVLEGRVVPWP